MHTEPAARSALARWAVRLEFFTVAWNSVEALVALVAGALAGSVALTGFGGDSLIEVAAAAVVTGRLLAELRGAEPDEAKERRALRIIAGTFAALALYVTVSGVRDLVTYSEPERSIVGVALTALSVVVMPLLARAKRRTGRALGNRLVVADAAETSLCSYLSASTLGGLLLNAVFGWWWADPIAGFFIAAVALREARETWHGDLCCD